MMTKTPANLVAQTRLPTPLGPMTAAATGAATATRCGRGAMIEGED